MSRHVRATTGLLSTLLLTALLLGSAANAVAAISGVDVEPASLVAGANGDVVVNFTTGLPLIPTNTVTITFPAGYDVSGATKPTDCTGADGTGGESILDPIIVGQVVTLTYSGTPLVDEWEAGTKTCTLGNITNPTTAGSTATYSVATSLESAVNGTADTIVAAALDEIVFTATHGSTDADTTKDFDAEPRDQFGNVRVDTIVYSIQSGSGSIDSGSGVFTPNQTGTTVIKAAVGAVSNTTSITVSAGALDNVAFTAAPTTTDADTQKTFTAIARDANLNPTGDTITYTIDSGSGSIDSGSGVFTPNQTGTTVIKAASGAVSTTTSIVVSAGSVDSVAFTAAPATTDADTQKTFTAIARDANLNPTGDTITYSIDSGSGAVNSTTGVFTPDKVGTTVVKAAAGVVSTTSSIVVSAGAADSVAFTSAPTTTDTATTKTFVAKVYDANLNLVGDTIVYSIQSGSGSINSTTGEFTPDAAGTTVILATSGALTDTATVTVTVPTSTSNGGGGNLPIRTSYGSVAGSAVQPAPQKSAEHYIEMRKGVVSSMIIRLDTEQSLVITVNTYDFPPDDLPPGYGPTSVHFDIEVQPNTNVTDAEVNLAPILASLIGHPADELVILHKENGEWVEVPTTIQVDGENFLVSFTTDNFSPFALAHKEQAQEAPEPQPGAPIEPDEPEGGGVSLGSILLLAGMGVLLALSVASIVLSRRKNA